MLGPGGDGNGGAGYTLLGLGGSGVRESASPRVRGSAGPRVRKSTRPRGREAANGERAPGKSPGPVAGQVEQVDQGYLSWKYAVILESSCVVIVVREHAPGVFGVCQFGMN